MHLENYGHELYNTIKHAIEKGFNIDMTNQTWPCLLYSCTFIVLLWWFIGACYSKEKSLHNLWFKIKCLALPLTRFSLLLMSLGWCWRCYNANYTLKNAGLNTTQRWVKYGRTQRLGYYPEGWVKHLTQLLVENNPACVLSDIYPAVGCI